MAAPQITELTGTDLKLKRVQNGEKKGSQPEALAPENNAIKDNNWIALSE